MADVAIGDEPACACERAQCCRSGECGAVDHSGAGNIQPLEHVVKQLRVTAGASDIECFEEFVSENVHRVELKSAVEPCAFCAYIGDVQRQIRRELPLNSEVEALNIRVRAVRGIHLDGLGSLAIQRTRLERDQL